MPVDLKALKAKLAAQAAASKESEDAPVNSVPESSGVTSDNATTSSNVVVPVATSTGVTQTTGQSTNTSVATVNPPAKLGTSKTTEINHLDFLGKLNQLADAIHKQHPTMPVLLMQIHKQLRTDPELVTTLDEDAIGVIVKGLQIQTKTELVAEVQKKASTGRAKKIPGLSVDML